MTSTVTSTWERKRTSETRKVEEVLSRGDFEKVDAYRYNPASIRVRVIDSRFEGLSLEKRDAMVEPLIAKLPEKIQADIISLFTFAPNELKKASNSSKAVFLNAEFEEASPSVL